MGDYEDSDVLYRIFRTNRLPEELSKPDWSGHLTCALDNLPEAKRQARYVSSERSVLASFDAAEIFGPIPSNPSDKGRSRKMLQTFCYAAKSGFVNSTDSSIEDFIGQLIDYAQQKQRAGTQAGTNYRPATLSEAHLLGGKGMGKTHFLNYVLTKYIKRLNEAKVMWVRLSLSREYGIEQTPIAMMDWYKAQLARIALRYYEQTSPYQSSNNPKIDIVNQLRAFIKARNLDANDKHALRFSLERMIERFFDKTKELPIDPDWVNPLLADEIFSILVRNGWSFIAIIDQMDLLSHSITLKDKFVLRGRQLNLFRAAVQNLPIFILLSSRPESSDFLSRAEEEHRESLIHSSNIQRPLPIQFHLGTVDFRVFIARREEYAKNSIGKTYRVATEIGLVNDQVFSLAGTNLRSYVQLVVTILENNSRIQEYEFTERAMLLDYVYPRIPFSYERGSQGLVRRFNPAGVNFDIMYLPSIFRAPHAANSPDNEREHDLLSKCVLGLRTLIMLSGVSKQKVSCIQLASLMEQCFDYDATLVRLALEEFLDFELIRAGSVRPGVISSFDRLELTARGFGIIKRFIYDPTYLALCLYSLPVPSSIVTRIAVKSPRASTEPLVDWVTSKVYSAISMASIIRAAMQVRIKKERLVSDDTPSGLVLGVDAVDLVNSFNNECEEVCRRIEHEVIRTCISAVRGLMPLQQGEVMGELQRFAVSS